MADRSVSVVLRAVVTPYQSAMARATTSTAMLNTQVGRLTPAIGRLSGGLNSMGPGLDTSRRGLSDMATQLTGLNPKLLGAGGIVFGLKQAVDASIAWESALTGVAKTVDASDATIEQLGENLKQLSTQMPTSAVELAGVAEAAGQLGIQTENIVGFTETMAMLGETTNLSAQDAATTLARFANIVGTSQNDFDRLGAVIVGLGNNFATTEREIADMALRIAGAGRQIGLSEGQILAYAAALSSVGIEAEAGGTAISRVFLEMQTAVMDGGDALQGFAEVAGMAVPEFARLFRDDAGTAVQAFIEGLGAISESGGNTAQVLDDLELGEIRVRDALLRTSGAADVLNEALGMQTELWDEAIALQDEFNKRNATTEAGLKRAGNSLTRLIGGIGEFLKPAADAAGSVVSEVSNLGYDILYPKVGEGGEFVSNEEFNRQQQESAANRARGYAADADRLMGLARHYGALEDAVDDATGPVEDFADAQSRAARATREALSALQAETDHLLAQTDPLFGAIDGWIDYQDALAELEKVRGDTEASAEDLARAERNVAEAAIRSREGLSGLIDENGNLVYSTDEVIRALAGMGVPPEVINRILTDIRTVQGELNELAGLDPTVTVHVRVDRAELDRLRAEFGFVATGRPGQGGRTSGTGTTQQDTFTTSPTPGSHWDNIPRGHTGLQGRHARAASWLDHDERLAVMRTNEDIVPAHRAAEGMASTTTSTRIGRAVTVSEGAIQLVVRDANEGMREAAHKLDLMAGGYI